MENNNSTRTYQVIIAVLAIVALIALYGWLVAGRKAPEGLDTYRVQLKVACSDVRSDSGKERCSAALSDFRLLLEQYNTELARLSESMPLETGTTTQE